jgi:phosphoglycerate dehydrogenase-like enzyme
VLKAHRILGAALDVLVKEPPAPDNPLLKMDNVLITPHVAGVTIDTWRRRSEIVFQNMQRVWEGHPPLSPVDPSALR